MCRFVDDVDYWSSLQIHSINNNFIVKIESFGGQL